MLKSASPAKQATPSEPDKQIQHHIYKTMKISILTLFPEMFQGPFDYSIVNRAKKKGKTSIEFINIRDFGIGKHKIVDDTPYGGGIGMVMRVDVLHRALEFSKNQINKIPASKRKIILLSASGKLFTQEKAKSYSQLKHLILICGHYEGIDDRIKDFIDEEISIGDFVVTGGEIPAMLITDAIIRLLSGVLKEGATENESFSTNIDKQTLLEYPQYTKPKTYENLQVPDVLLSGNHQAIARWRKTESISKTKKNRQELLMKNV